MLFRDWYTDTVDIYRIVHTKKGHLTHDERKLIAEAVPCRVYSSQISGGNPRNTAAATVKTDKLACDIDVDILADDELIVKRGGLIGGTKTERYIAGQPQDFYDPVGMHTTGLDHKEVGLLADNITRSE